MTQTPKPQTQPQPKFCADCQRFRPPTNGKLVGLKPTRWRCAVCRMTRAALPHPPQATPPPRA